MMVNLLLACMESLNPLKRVKFISIWRYLGQYAEANSSLNPLKRVKFISIPDARNGVPEADF